MSNVRRWAAHQQPNLIDLNQATIDQDGSVECISERPHRSMSIKSSGVTVVFAEHARLLCLQIEKWPVVVGCVAWLTNSDILKALQGREVCIVVQKEDWLRPDTEDWTMQRQRIQYGLLKGVQDKHAFGVGYNYCGSPDLEPVYCCGIIGTQKQMRARMHHKFLVFGEYETRYSADKDGPDTDVPYEYEVFMPKAVWTGSFNMTGNATRSLENAVLIEDEVIAAAYTDEWITVLGISEELDWNAEWVATNFRVGS